MAKQIDLGRVKGKSSTINGQTAIIINGADNINIGKLDNDDSKLEISSPEFKTHIEGSNPHNITKSTIGLDKVENKSSSDIIGEITKDNIVGALGYTPMDNSNTPTITVDSTLSTTSTNAIQNKVVDKAIKDVNNKAGGYLDIIPGRPGQILTFTSDGTMYPIYHTGALNEIYGFELNMDESNPASMIKYIGRNASFTPAKMDYSQNRFDYGDWADAWFIKNINPVVIGYDGKIMYALDKNNYKLKKDGGDSGITSESLQGNVMIGIPTVWIKVDNSNPRKPKFWFSNNQVDSSYKAYAHINGNGVVNGYTYISAYDGYKDGSNRIRSISGKHSTGNQLMNTARNQCKSNGNNWDMGVYSDRVLIQLLLMLIGKSTNTQQVFGNGNSYGFERRGTGEYESIFGKLPSGKLDDKGLFYGYNDEYKPVKVFGIENFWGNTEKRTLGLVAILDSSKNVTLKYKLTKGTQDGSGTSDYNLTGHGYITAFTDKYNNINGSNLKEVKAGNFGIVPYNAKATSTTYFCDNLYYNFNITKGEYPAFFGGSSNGRSYCGAFACNLSKNVSYYDTDLGCNLSFKP